MATIYKITNLENGKVYVGKTCKTYTERMREHLKTVKSTERNPNYPHHSIHNAIIKYGFRNFKFEIIECCSIKDAPEREAYWIKHYDSYKSGYNETLGGDGKPIYDHDEIVLVFKETRNIAETARIMGCHVDTVSETVKASGEKTMTSEDLSEYFGAPLQAKDKNGKIMKKFNSFRKANTWLKENYKELSKSNAGDPRRIKDAIASGAGLPAGKVFWEYQPGFVCKNTEKAKNKPIPVKVLKDGKVVATCKSIRGTVDWLSNTLSKNLPVDSAKRTIRCIMRGDSGYKTYLGFTFEKA